MGEYSEHIQSYFSDMKRRIEHAYELAEKARNTGYDPVDKVEVPMVENMAERVEGLISVIAPQIRNSGVSGRIKELEAQYGSLNWRVALSIGLDVAKQTYCSFESEKEAIEIGIRTGFAYLTMGIVASPLEGLVELRICKTKDGKDYFNLRYAGPIRSAGGTGASVSVLLADYIRINLGYAAYDPTEEEAKRFVTELHDYHERVTNLQYLPSEDELYFLGKHLPIQVDGDGSEQIEVSNQKDLERVETNRIRNGVCLTMGEGIAQKAEKLWKQLSKWGSDFGLDHWFWLKDFVELKKKMHAKKDDGAKGEEEPKILPDYTFVKDLVGGRPVFTHPMAFGGFRLRYGRSRTSGYSSYSIHPATMFVLEDFIAVGTQLKNERPGKGCTLTACDTLEGPIVKLTDGSVKRLEDSKEARRVAKNVEKVLFMGDMLINYGDFTDRGHTLAPPGYCEEWWAQELAKAAKEKLGGSDPARVAETAQVDEADVEQLLSRPLYGRPSAETAIALSQTFKVPLHPYHTYHWKGIETQEVKPLREMLLSNIVRDAGETKMVIPHDDETKRRLERIGVAHTCAQTSYIVLGPAEASILKYVLRLGDSVDETCFEKESALAVVQAISPIPIRDKSGIFIGARMGRPEKSKMRVLQGSPHVLFPVGEEGGRMRSFQAALEAGKITGDFPVTYCPTCERETIFRRCEGCGAQTLQLYHCSQCKTSEKETCEHGEKRPYANKEISTRHYFNAALRHLNMRHYPDLIKGVRGTSNKTHDAEHLAKGILRAKYGVFVNKDGTTRYDMTQMAITHFKPMEVGTSVEGLKKLGYTHDIYGEPLTESTQVLEMKPQDIILPKNTNAIDKGSHIVLSDVTRYIDDLLQHFYGCEPYYNVSTQEDLVGHIVMVLAPHTSGGIAGRIIGFSETQGLFAHPMLHAGTRRDCDGDEACVCLLMDVLLNFSRKYLPSTRGATQDAPLVLTWKLTPAEVDDMVFNMDIVWSYPLEFYEAAQECKKPWDVDIEVLEKYLGDERQYEGFGFTHDITDMNDAVLCSAYKTLPTMQDKLTGQMSLAEKISAVDESDVARLVIEKHFLKDIKGNLRKFSMQQFRCVNCNEKYRRPPLRGICPACNGKIMFTISEGSIVKYLEPSMSLARHYHLPVYLQQTLDILKRRVEGVFGKEKDKQVGLGQWFG